MYVCSSVSATCPAADSLCDYFEKVQPSSSFAGSSSSSDNAVCSSSFYSAAGNQAMANVDSNSKDYLQNIGSKAFQAASRLAKVLPPLLQEAKGLMDEYPFSITPCRLEGEMMDFGIMAPVVGWPPPRMCQRIKRSGFLAGPTSSSPTTSMTKVHKHLGMRWATTAYLVF